MKIFVTFDPEDGTGYVSKAFTVYAPASPNELWYVYVKMMREILITWRWRAAGKPPREDREKTLAYRAEAREWQQPINQMIAAMNDKKGT